MTNSCRCPAAHNDQMPLPPRFPPSVDPRVLESAASGLAPTGSITFLVDNDVVTYAVDGSTIRVEAGQGNGDAIVRLTRHAWDDTVSQVRTFINLLLSDDLTFDRGGFEQLADWEPILTYLHVGVPPYDPARANFHPRPTGAGGRRTMYVNHYPPTLWHHVGPGQGYNDLLRNRTEEIARLQ